MKYKTAVFDMDGTILNTLDDLCDAVNFTLRHYGFPERTLGEIRSFLGGGGRNLMRLSLPAGSPDALIDEAFTFYQPYYLAHCNDKTAPYPGIPELLADMKTAGIRLAVVSSKPDAPAQKLSKQFFGELFDICIGDRPGLARKPDPQALYIALEELYPGSELASPHGPKEGCVFIGDSEYDILVARNAGIPGVAVSWGFRTREQLTAIEPDFLADSTKKLRTILLAD